MGRRARSRSWGAVRAVLANVELRRVELAYALFVTSKYGTRVAILVYAFERGGAAATGLAAVIMLLPAAFVAPLASVLGDRIRRERALLLGYAAQAVSVAATAAAMFAEAPTWVVYALTALVAASVTLTRPVQSALLPQLARSPDELIAANVVAGSIYSAMTLVGPISTGVLIAYSGPGLALSAFAVLLVVATGLVLALDPHPASVRHGGPLHEVAAGFRAVTRAPDQRLVVGLMVGQSLLAGAQDVLLVVIALDALGLPPSAVGFLAATRGVGGLLGGLWGLGLVGKLRLTAAMAAGQVVYGFATGSLGLAAVAATLALSLVVAGSGYARADIAGRTLLQRVAPDDVVARVFGVLEGLNQAALAAGAAVAPLLVALLGVRAGTVLAGLLLPTTILVLRGRIRAVDRTVSIPERELEVLRTVDLFSSLAPPTLEGIAGRLEPVSVRHGAAIIREGDPGDRFYIVAEGEVDVTRRGRPVTTLGPGDYFGEIALLRDVPRTATVKAKTHTELLELERVDFLETVIGHAVVREVADETVRERTPKD